MTKLVMILRTHVVFRRLFDKAAVFIATTGFKDNPGCDIMGLDVAICLLRSTGI